MLTRLFRHCAYLGRSLARALRHRLSAATKPAAQGVVVGAFADLVRGRPALVAENAFLRQQILILRRSVKRPRCTPTDRALLVLLASRLRAWRQALLIVQPGRCSAGIGRASACCGDGGRGLGRHRSRRWWPRRSR